LVCEVASIIIERRRLVTARAPIGPQRHHEIAITELQPTPLPTATCDLGVSDQAAGQYRCLPGVSVAAIHIEVAGSRESPLPIHSRLGNRASDPCRSYVPADIAAAYCHRCQRRPSRDAR
jgi:hypothetical protein